MFAGEPSTGIFSIAFEGKSGIAVGGDYTKEWEGRDNAIHTDDGGKSWQLVKTKAGSTPFPFRSCAGFVDKTTLIAIGPSGGNISRDGGKTWQSLPGKAGFHTLDIAGKVVWAAGADGRVGRLEL